MARQTNPKLLADFFNKIDPKRTCRSPANNHLLVRSNRQSNPKP